MTVAKAFFRSATAGTGVTPDRIATNGHEAYLSAIRTELGKHVRYRASYTGFRGFPDVVE
jgi:hypothetical protein